MHHRGNRTNDVQEIQNMDKAMTKVDININECLNDET